MAFFNYFSGSKIIQENVTKTVNESWKILYRCKFTLSILYYVSSWLIHINSNSSSSFFHCIMCIRRRCRHSCRCRRLSTLREPTLDICLENFPLKKETPFQNVQIFSFFLHRVYLKAKLTLKKRQILKKTCKVYRWIYWKISVIASETPSSPSSLLSSLSMSRWSASIFIIGWGVIVLVVSTIGSGSSDMPIALRTPSTDTTDEGVDCLATCAMPSVIFPTK